LDRAALAGAVAALEDDADLGAGVRDPELQLDELDVQLLQRLVVVLARHVDGRAAAAGVGGGRRRGLLVRHGGLLRGRLRGLGTGAHVDSPSIDGYGKKTGRTNSPRCARSALSRPRPHAMLPTKGNAA